MEEVVSARTINKGVSVVPLKRASVPLEVSFAVDDETSTLDDYVKRNMTAGLLIILKGESFTKTMALATRRTQGGRASQGSAYDGVTVRQLLTMTSGVRWNEDYTDPESDVAKFIDEPSTDGSDPTITYMARFMNGGRIEGIWLNPDLDLIVVTQSAWGKAVDRAGKNRLSGGIKVIHFRGGHGSTSCPPSSPRLVCLPPP